MILVARAYVAECRQPTSRPAPPLYLNAIGGVRLLVPSSRLEEARQLLEQAHFSEEELVAEAQSAAPPEDAEQ
jgi:hypothetical protein